MRYFLRIITACFLPFATFADSVGLNFVGNTGGQPVGTDLLASDSAGVIPQINWNNGPHASTRSTPFSLHDDLGSTSTMSATWTTIGGDWRTPINAASNPLFDGYLDDTSNNNPSSVIITGIPYAKYDAYMYFGSDGSNRSAWFQVNNDAGTRVFGRTNSNPFNGYVQATASSEGTAVASTYAHFTDLSGSSLTLQWDRQSSNTGLHGIQIVQTASPTNPVVVNAATSEVESFTAILHGEVIDDGNKDPNTTIYYGTVDGITDTNLWQQAIDLGIQGGTFSASATGLTQNTTYYFRAFAQNSGGSDWAAPSDSFTTLTPILPAISSQSAVGISAVSAVLNGQVTNTGNDRPDVTLWYGTSDGGTNPGAWQHSLVLGKKNASFSAAANGLMPETTYYFNARASNAAGASWAGSSLSFTTQVAAVFPIVINEIHYDPMDRTSYSEFIELYNAHTGTVELAGWYFSKGIAFTFPAGSSIAAGATVVIAQDTADFNAAFGFNPLAEWGKTSRLSNNGETLTLRNAIGDKIDEVDYGIGFPWPTTAHGEGPSMELLNPSIDNDLSGAWRSGGPTPNNANSVFTANPPPRIRQVSPESIVITSGVPLTVSAKITDPDGVSTVMLEYQVVDPGDYLAIDDPRYATNWTAIAMTTTGEVYSATLPAGLHTHRRLIRYRITAEDSGGAFVRVPYTDDAQPNFASYVYDTVPAWTGAAQPGVSSNVTYSSELLTSIPVYQLITTRKDHEDAQFIPDSTRGGGYTGSEYLWDGCLVYDGEVYDHIRYRARGGGWRYAMGKNMWKFDFNRARSFQARDDYGRKYNTTWDKVNFSALIQQGNFRQRGEQGLFEAAGFKLHNLADNPAPKTHYVHFRVVEHANEEGPSASQYDDDFQGLYLAVEQLDGRFLEEHDLPDGNLYKMEGGTGELNNQGPDQPSNKADLNAFLGAFDGAATQPEAWWRDNLDLQNWYSFFAIVTAIHDNDIHANKNYFFFNNPALDRWQAINWDLDLCWTTTYRLNDPPNDRLEQDVLVIPALKREYENRAREIIDLVFNREQTGMILDEVAQWVYTPGQPSLVDADRAMWDYNPILTSGYINGSKAGHGKYYEDSPSGDFAGMLAKLKDYVDTRGAYMLGQSLDNDTDIPDTPVLSYVGDTNYPVNALTFQTSAFSAPASSFQAMQWRIAEITNTNAPGFDPLQPRKYEIEADYLSPVMNTFTNAFTFPGGTLRVGREYRARVKMQGDDNRWSHWSAPVQLTIGEANNLIALQENLRISELMYAPTGDQAYEFIELCNTSDAVSLVLDGITFTAGISYSFPTGAVLSAGAYLLLTPATNANNFAAFRAHYGLGAATEIYGPYTGKLNNAGETLRLKTSAGGAEIFSFDYLNGRGWPIADGAVNHSLVPILERQGEGALEYGGHWRRSCFSGGSPGYADPIPVPSLVINEIVAHSDFSDTNNFPGYDSNDWIELYNRGSNAVNLADYFLSDNRDNLTRWEIPGGIVPPKSFVAYDEVTGFHRPITNGFGLDKTGEEVLLSHLPADGTNRVADAVRFQGEDNGRSLSRISDGQPYFAHTRSTRSTTNLPPIATILITEVMYNPPQGPTNIDEDASFEFIELYNPTLQPTNLFNATGGYKLRGGSDFNFPPGQSIAAGATCLIVPFDPGNAVAVSAFETYYSLTPGSVPLYGPSSQKLSDRTDRITLERPGIPDAPDFLAYDITIDELIYLDQEPFPRAADATGLSLHRFSARRSGNDPANWFSNIPTPGNVDLAALPDEDGDVLDDNWELTFFGNLDRDGSGDFDNDHFLDRSEFLAGTVPLDPGSLLAVRIRHHPSNPQLVQLSWPSVAGKTYRIFAAPDAGSPLVELASGLPATPPENTQSVDISTMDLEVFYIGVD